MEQSRFRATLYAEEMQSSGIDVEADTEEALEEKMTETIYEQGWQELVIYAAVWIGEISSVMFWEPVELTFKGWLDSIPSQPRHKI